MEATAMLHEQTDDPREGGGEETDVARDTRIEALLEEWKLPFELKQDFPIAKVKLSDGVQIRAEDNRAPKTTVEEYTTHLRHGAIFPPIVLTSNGLLVDGNTRLAACGRLDRRTFPAYLVKFPHQGLARLLGAALNQMGGDRLTEPEIAMAAEGMMEQGYGEEAIARTLGRSMSHVRNIRKDRTYREAVERNGLSTIDLPKALRRELAGVSHDEPFRALVQAAAVRKPSVKDLSTIVKKVQQARSDGDALATIQVETAKWGSVTGPPPNRKSLSTSKARTALRLVKQLLKVSEQPEDFVMLTNEEAAAAWSRLATLTTRVVAQYQAGLPLTQ